MNANNFAPALPWKIIEPRHETRSIYPPFDLDDEIILPNNFSLIRLCCKEIVRDTVFLDELRVHLPHNLYPVLMSEALHYEFSKSSAILIRNWPLEMMSMSELIPNILAERFVLVEWDITSPRLRKAKKDLLFLVDLFFQIVKETATSRLRVLDLRGVTLAKDMMKYLIARVDLEIINMGVGVIETDKYHIIIDCKISEEIGKRVNELLNLYRRNDNIKVQLHFSKLVLGSKNDANNLKLFETINPTEIVALCIEPEKVTLKSASSLQKFSSLVALDISFLYSEFQKFPDKKIEMLPVPLESMPHLRRLGLKYRRKNLAFFVPISALSKLEYLDIPSVHPTDNLRIIGDDLRLLTSVPLNLREFYVRGNKVIESQLDLWRTLLESLAPTLRVLDMNECFTNDKLFGPIVNFILPLSNLRILHLLNGIIVFTAATLLEHVPKLGSLARLKRIQLLYTPSSEYVKIGNVSGYVQDEVWRKHIDERMASQKFPPVVINWMCLI